ncbi:MAG: hypothetical protein AVDCRST_MAG83-3311, partial [uncultured Arthrobacter sp.]
TGTDPASAPPGRLGRQCPLRRAAGGSPRAGRRGLLAAPWRHRGRHPLRHRRGAVGRRRRRVSRGGVCPCGRASGGGAGGGRGVDAPGDRRRAPAVLSL